MLRRVRDDSADPPVQGVLHDPGEPAGDGIVLTHGAGSSCEAPLLVDLAGVFEARGIAVLRCDLPYRQARPHGPPLRGADERDRAGLRRAVDVLRASVRGRVFLGGHSYGGRQATLLAASEPSLVSALLLLSYPLHPPDRPAQLRTAHFPRLRTPALFVQGSRDPFGSIEDLRTALGLIPARTELVPIEGAAHDLRAKSVAQTVASAFLEFLSEQAPVRIPVRDVFDLHTVPPRDVEGVVQEYLEEANRLGLKALRIIHGRGIGVQREIVRAVLARTPWVAAYSDAPEDAGGWGATIVTLR